MISQYHQSQYNTYKDKRQHQQDNNRFPVAAEQKQQGDEHKEECQRQISCQCGIAFCLAFLLSEVFHGVTFGHFNLLLHLLPYTVEGGNGIHTAAWVACAIITICRL